MKLPIYLISISIILFSCKKDKLEDGKEIFIGKWNWAYTDHKYHICLGLSDEEVLTPETEGMTYSMEFFEKGIVKFYENENLLSRDRLVFFQFGSPGYSENHVSFAIYLNNKIHDSEYLIQGAISPDSLVIIRGFPFQDPGNGCEYYTSHFVKE